MSWCITLNARTVATVHSIAMTKRQAKDLALDKGPGWVPVRTEDIYFNTATNQVVVRPGMDGKYRRSLERYS